MSVWRVLNVGILKLEITKVRVKVRQIRKLFQSF